MPNRVIKNYRSSVPGAVPGSLEPGQFAINEADGRLFTRRRNGGVRESSLKSDAEIQNLVDNAVSDLIGGAPGALNTLNELAAAIGDNANYAATVTGLISAKADKTTVDNLQDQVNGKADASHNHDSRYYTEAEINTKLGTINAKLAGKSLGNHTHDSRYYTESEINNLLAAKGKKPTISTNAPSGGVDGDIWFKREA